MSTAAWLWAIAFGICLIVILLQRVTAFRLERFYRAVMDVAIREAVQQGYAQGYRDATLGRGPDRAQAPDGVRIGVELIEPS